MKNWKIKLINYWKWKKGQSKSFSLFSFLLSDVCFGLCVYNFGVSAAKKIEQPKVEPPRIDPLQVDETAVIRGNLYQVVYENKGRHRITLQHLGRVK